MPKENQNSRQSDSQGKLWEHDIELIAAYQKTSDGDMRRSIEMIFFNRYANLRFKVAKKYGIIGIFDSWFYFAMRKVLEKFDSSINQNFFTYLMWYVRQAAQSCRATEFDQGFYGRKKDEDVWLNGEPSKTQKQKNFAFELYHPQSLPDNYENYMAQTAGPPVPQETMESLLEQIESDRYITLDVYRGKDNISRRRKLFRDKWSTVLHDAGILSDAKYNEYEDKKQKRKERAETLRKQRIARL